MALKIRNRLIVIEAVEWGVRFDSDNFEVWCLDEEDARATRAMTGGALIQRDVYLSEAREVAE